MTTFNLNATARCYYNLVFLGEYLLSTSMENREGLIWFDWTYERSDNEVSIIAKGQWSDYQISVTWVDDFEGINIVCGFNLSSSNTPMSPLPGLKGTGTVNPADSIAFSRPTFPTKIYRLKPLFKHF